MGLYDNYRLSNSTAIPEFSGSILPDLRYANTELNKRYDYALGNLTNTGNAIKDAPVNPMDAEDYQKLYDNVQGKIQEISKRQDLENIVPATQLLAQQTARQLKPFVQSNAAWQSALQKLNDKELNLDAGTKSLLMAKMADDYKNRKNKFSINPTTGEIEGGFSADTNFAKNVDLPERVKKYVGDAVARKYGTEGVTFDGTYIIKNGVKTEKLSRDQIAQFIDAGLATDPEAQAFIRQQSDLKGWQFGKNAKSTYNELTKPIVTGYDKSRRPIYGPNPIKKSVDALVEQGIPLKDAVQEVMRRSSFDGLVQSMKGLGSKYEKNDYEYSEDKSIDPRFLKQMDYAHEAKTAGGGAITMPSTNQPANDAQTFDDLDGQINTARDEIAGASKIAKDWVQLDKNGQPLMQNGQYVPVAGKDLTNLPYSVQNALNTLDGRVAQKQELERRKTATLDEAAKTYGFKNFTEANKKVSDEWIKALEKDSRTEFNQPITKKDKYGVSVIDHYEKIPKSDVVTALKDGKASFTYGPDGSLTGIRFSDGKPDVLLNNIGITGNAIGANKAIETGREILDNIKQKAKDNYQTYSKNYSVVNPAIKLDEATPADKAFAKNNIETISGQRGALDWVNGKGEAMDKEDVAALNLTGAKVSGTTKVGNRIVQTIVVPGDKGKEDDTYQVAFPATSNIGQRFFESSKNSNDNGVQEFNALVNPDSQNQEISQLEPNGRITVRGTDNLFIERTNDGTDAAFKIGMLKPDGTVQYLTNKRGTTFYTKSPIRAEIVAHQQK